MITLPKSVLNALALYLIFNSLPSMANTYYVSTTGNNSNNCTSASAPCLGIQYTYDNKATCGDTILVAPGTYTDYYNPRGGANVGIWLNKRCTSASPLVLRSTIRGGAIIDAQDNADRWRCMTLDASYHTIDGFKMTNAHRNCLHIDSGGNNTIQNNEIYNNGLCTDNVACPNEHTGVYESHTPSVTGGDVFRNNYSHDNGVTTNPLHGHGFYLSGPDTLVVNNIASKNKGNGFQASAQAAITNMRLYNNVAYGNEDHGIVIYSPNPPTSFSGLTIENNIIYKNGFSDGQHPGIGTCNTAISGGGITINTNISNGNAAADGTDTCGGSYNWRYSATNTINTNPLFSNATGAFAQASDFIPLPQSAAVHAGLGIAVMTNDYNGTARPPTSIGAYEP